MAQQSSPNYARPRWIASRKAWRIDVQRNGKRKSFYSPNPTSRGKAEALRKAEAWLEQGNRSDMRFRTAWALFLEDYKLRNKFTSYDVIASRGKAHLEHFNPRIVRDITKADYQQVITDAYNNGARAKKTLQGIGTTITTFCKWAATQGIIDDNQVPLYFSYPAKATKVQKRILQPDALKRLFNDDCADNWYIYVFRFLTLTGLRRGEVCALQHDRDYDGDVITVRESYTHDNILTSVKSKDSYRTVILTELAKQQITDHRAQAGDSVYLFGAPDGEHIHPRVLGNNWRKWRDANGVEITLHELRHTYISYTRLKTDISLDDLKQLYGHTDSFDTEQVYVHSIDKSPEELKAEREAAELQAQQINKVFTGLLKEKRGQSCGHKENEDAMS